MNDNFYKRLDTLIIRDETKRLQNLHFSIVIISSCYVCLERRVCYMLSLHLLHPDR